jgi:hypothetical protein
VIRINPGIPPNVLRIRIAVLAIQLVGHIAAYRKAIVAAMKQGWYGGCCIGGAPMVINILNELLLFSCLASFVTGIVIAAASLL